MKEILKIYETEDDEEIHIEVNEDEMDEIGITDFFTIVINNIVEKINDISIKTGMDIGKKSEKYWRKYSEEILTEEKLNKQKKYFTNVAEHLEKIIKDKKQVTQKELEKYVREKLDDEK